MALVIDTGVLYAALDDRDAMHGKSLDLLAGADEELVVPAPVLVELDYFVQRLSPGHWVDFCETVSAGTYAIHPLTPDLLLAAALLQARYRKLSIGLVDAAVFVTCEALRESKVATLDRRDFTVLRTSDGKALELLPAGA